jgi:hypothetical protein
MVFVAQELGTIQEKCQDKSCVFWQGKYRNKDHNPEKSVPGSSPGENDLFSSETKHDGRMAPRPELFVSLGR